MPTKPPWRLAAAFLVAVIVLAGCGSSDDLGGKVVEDGLGCQPTQVEQKTDAPTVKPVADVGAKVKTEDLLAGKGCGTSTATYLTLDLVGATAKDAKVFTNTFSDKRPITATLGSGQLIPGLEEGLTDMLVGGRRQLVVPADKAYGKAGNEAQGIGPNEALVFVVDLVAVTDSPLFCNQVTSIPAGKEGGDKPTEVEMPVKAPEGKVQTADLKVGTGDPVTDGNYVTLNYLGVSCSSGQQFESSWDSGEPIDVTLGQGTIPGFADGIKGMKVGGRRRIEIPAPLAYGAQGQPPTIGPNDPLVFVIEVVKSAATPPSTTAPAPAPSIPTDPGTATTVAPGDGATTAPPAGASSTVAPGDATTTPAGATPSTTAAGGVTTTTGP